MFCVVLTTAKDRAEAERIAERLVEEKLAACVSIAAGATSIYRWRGGLERADEVLVVIKTSREKLDDLIPRIKELHSYEVPEVLVLPVERGSPDYLRWVEESLR